MAGLTGDLDKESRTFTQAYVQFARDPASDSARRHVVS